MLLGRFALKAIKMIINTYNSSFGPTTLFHNIGGTSPIEVVFYYMVRTVTPTLLSTVTVQFSWTDDRGVLCSETRVVPLNLLSSQVENSVIVNVGINESFTVTAALIGGGTFDIRYNTVGI